MSHLEVSLAQVFVLLHIEPEVENIFRVLALQEDLLFVSHYRYHDLCGRSKEASTDGPPLWSCGLHPPLCSSATHVETE